MHSDGTLAGADGEAGGAPRHQMVFVGGLHHSGSSLLARCLAEHPVVSGFRNTGMPEDEGQHLQSVYPPARAHGGPGKFCFDPAAHLTDASPLVTEENRERLFGEWSRYWDLTKPVLLENSPPNLIQTRFLQALFPEAHFVMVMRHPVPVAYATQKWSRGPTGSLIEHWLVAHERFAADRPHIRRMHVVRYEDLVERSESTLDGVFAFLGLVPHRCGLDVRPHVNAAYLQRWREYATAASPDDRADAQRIMSEYGSRVAACGYELEARRAGPALEGSGHGTPGPAAPVLPSSGTASREGGPDFLIIGAQKAGTTSLFNYLAQHPNVVPPDEKELHFFDYEVEYRQGIEWYHASFPRRTLAPDGTATITGEATPYYLFDRRVPERVASFLPAVKLVALLRNPVDRAYSQYQMTLRKGQEDRSFEEAVDDEHAFLRDAADRRHTAEHYGNPAHRLHSYLARGIYVDQLERWAKPFPRDQMLVLRAEDLFADPQTTVCRVLAFLGLPDWTLQKAAAYNAHPYPRLAPTTRRGLAEFFEPHNRKLYDFLGRDLGWR